jgi:AcrR family transcriptional regulator
MIMAGRDRRRQIIEAAIQLLRERPFREVTVDHVAERAGVTRGLVLYYFQTRDNLFLETAVEYLDQVREIFGPPPAEPGGDWIIGEIDTFLELAERDPVIFDSSLNAMGVVAGVSEVLNEMTAFTASRVAAALGAPPDHPLLNAVLQAWGRSCADLAVGAARARLADRDRLRAVILGHLRGAVAAVVDGDPELSLDLPAASFASR